MSHQDNPYCRRSQQRLILPLMRYLAKSGGRHFSYLTWGGATGIWWVEPRDAADSPESCVVQNVTGAEAEQPCLAGTFSRLSLVKVTGKVTVHFHIAKGSWQPWPSMPGALMALHYEQGGGGAPAPRHARCVGNPHRLHAISSAVAPSPSSWFVGLWPYLRPVEGNFE